MKKILKVLSAILLIALTGYGAYVGFCKVWLVFKSIDPTLAAGIIAASATVVVSVVTVMLSKRQEQKVEIENQLRVKKVPVYEKIIEFIFLITFAEKLGKKQPSEKEMIKFFADTTRDLVIWGSHRVGSYFVNSMELISISMI
jgi:formate hydrogenlyase subunit 3/multisubunit Na+/H+ antiporter MnhD subunit